jgi:hypothetical protein
VKTIKVSEASGAQLDWLVAKCEDNLYPTGAIRLLDGRVFSIEAGDHGHSDRWQQYNPSTNWAQGGPIIEHAQIATMPFGNTSWRANLVNEDNKSFWGEGPTPLIAAMRCYVASKLGNEVEVPNGLKGTP